MQALGHPARFHDQDSSKAEQREKELKESEREALDESRRSEEYQKTAVERIVNSGRLVPILERLMLAQEDFCLQERRKLEVIRQKSLPEELATLEGLERRVSVGAKKSIDTLFKTSPHLFAAANEQQIERKVKMAIEIALFDDIKGITSELNRIAPGYLRHITTYRVIQDPLKNVLALPFNFLKQLHETLQTRDLELLRGVADALEVKEIKEFACIFERASEELKGEVMRKVQDSVQRLSDPSALSINEQIYSRITRVQEEERQRVILRTQQLDQIMTKILALPLLIKEQLKDALTRRDIPTLISLGFGKNSGQEIKELVLFLKALSPDLRSGLSIRAAAMLEQELQELKLRAVELEVNERKKIVEVLIRVVEEQNLIGLWTQNLHELESKFEQQGKEYQKVPENKPALLSFFETQFYLWNFVWIKKILANQGINPKSWKWQNLERECTALTIKKALAAKTQEIVKELAALSQYYLLHLEDIRISIDDEIVLLEDLKYQSLDTLKSLQTVLQANDPELTASFFEANADVENGFLVDLSESLESGSKKYHEQLLAFLEFLTKAK
jgi:hypothetical protein